MELLQSLVSNLEQKHQQKADYVVSHSNLIMNEGKLLVAHQPHSYMPNEICHEGLAEKLGIPMQYYKKMRAERPELLDLSVGHWLKHTEGTKSLVRTYETAEGNIARAFLSNSYLALDNYDVLFAALDAVKRSGVRVDIVDAQVTDRRLYLAVTCPEVEVDATNLLKGYLER